MLIYGVALLLLIRFRPQGLLGHGLRHDPLLEIRGLTRRFGGVTAVKALDLASTRASSSASSAPTAPARRHVQPDQRPRSADAGDPVRGPRDRRLRPEAIAALGLARTFQHGRVFANLSVEDNVLIGAHTRLRAVRPRWPLFGPLAELALALLRPASSREEEALRAEAREILACSATG
jgi:branched-chain amino acid transport system ATP-binding protein